MSDRVKEQRARFSTVESESHFVQAGLEMFSADLMPRSRDAPLKQTESRFRRVCMNISVYVNSAVGDGFAFAARTLDAIRPT